MNKTATVEMLSTRQAAMLLGVSSKTIYRMEEKGLIQSIRTPGGQRRFNREDLENYLNASKSFVAPQNPSRYKPLHSFIKEKIAEYSLFEQPESDASSSVVRLQQKIAIRNTRSHKQYYDAGTNILRWIEEWDFKNYQTKTYTHGFHTYPAMFIPQVARKLIEVFSSEHDTICDIFCGSGTTLVESSLLNRNSIGIELNPLAVLIAKVKTTPINPQTLTNNLKAILTDYESMKDVSPPIFSNINFWFSESVIKCLAKLKQAIWNISDENIRNFFSVCFSEVARIVSFTRHKEFKLFRDKSKLEKPFMPDVLGEFIRMCENNILGMKEYSHDVKPNAEVKIILGDSTSDNGIPSESVDFMITSPPYGDSRTTVAYGQFSRLPAQWLNLLPPKIKDINKELLGGNNNNINLNDPVIDLSNTLKLSIKNISGKDHERAKDVLGFYRDLHKALIQAHKILRPKKYLCLIVGNRTVKELVLKTDEIICELGENSGFVSQGILFRNIPNKRMPLKNSPTNVQGKTGLTIQKESIVLLKKV
jgi:excisionase family DNA binding protein